MSVNKILKISIMISFAFVFTDIALSCPEPYPPTIISPSDNDVFIAGKTYIDLCEAEPPYWLTWSGGGTFDPTIGTPVSWTAPSTTGSVTITVTNLYGSDQVEVQITNVIFVDEDATAGENDGSSWEDAFLDLQDGLSAASSGSHIWVAEGTYKPGTTVYHTFTLKDGVEVYGGFDPSIGDDTWAERDYLNNVTILSGDIDNDGELNNTNSHHVVTCTDENIDGSTRLDGFTITMGFADYWLCDGAGMKIEDCDPNVANCIFIKNRAYGSDGDGGGMGCLSSSPEVTNCVFFNNIAGDDGGALVNTKGSNGTFINCVFYGNNTNGENVESGQGKSNGGAIWNTRGENEGQAGSSPKFINCLIAGNSTVPGSANGGKRGGGVANKGADTDPVFINCTFTANTANWDGGGMCTKDDAEATVINCIFWDNEIGSGYSGFSIYNKDGGVTNVSYSDVNQPGYAGSNGNICQDPNFANPDEPNGPDNRLGTCDDGWRICFDSNCVDAGNGTATDAPDTDILGFERVDIRAVTNSGQGDPYSDMGAYEAVVEHVIFISVDGLAAYYLEPMVTAGNVPKIKRFIEEGLWTYDARPDYRWTKTLPNHVTMVTGRPVEKGSLESDTTHHGYTSNDDPSPTDTLHNTGNTGNPPTGYMYKASPFDIVHDRSMKTSMYAGKGKFVIFSQSYDSDGGRDDQVTPPDDGTKKLDIYECWGDKYDDVYSVTLVNTFITDACNDNTNFAFLHFKGPDIEGHDHNWNSDEWKYAVVQANNRLNSIFGLVENSSNEEWYYNTVVIMTADHGGINGGHGTPTIRQEYELPFGVWGHLVPKGNAYKYSNGTRSDPVNARGNDYDIPYNEKEQPIRHADGVDLGLSFMGLPAIDGALIKGMQIKLP